jgi:hypothetical protein
VDYSPRCIGTVPFVKKVVRRNGSRVAVISVVENIVQWPGVPDTVYVVTAGTPDELFLAGQRRLADFLQQHFPEVGVTRFKSRETPAYSITRSFATRRARC